MTYNDLSIKKYLNIKRILSNYKDYDDEFQLQIDLIAELFDMTPQEVNKLPLTKYPEYSRELSFLDEPLKYDGKNIPNSIVINGKSYDINKKLNNLSVGQYIDYQNYIKMQSEDYLPHILSIIIVPKGKEYNNGYDVLDVINEISMYLDIQTAKNIFGFFLKVSKKSINHSLYFLETLLMMEKIKMRKNKEKMREIQQAIAMVHSIRDGIG